MGNRWMSWLPDHYGCLGMSYLLNACDSRGAPSETSAVPRLSLLSRQSCHLRVEKRTCGGMRTVSPTLTRCQKCGDATPVHSPGVHLGSNDAAVRWLALVLCGSEGQFSRNSIQKDCREHCKTSWWRCLFGGSQPPRWRWKFGGRNNTINYQLHSNGWMLTFAEYSNGKLLDSAICRCYDIWHLHLWEVGDLNLWILQFLLQTVAWHH